ncbi:MAG: threonylcarbamoyl-AMP synthase [Candidatus Marinimicrobia bacterium]|nr:threonylcarbamoyl-AMP synthase [Candidatus Neomarinimicrobiota bacterium]
MIIDYQLASAQKKVLDALKDEELFVYPTDTLYGFGGNARSQNVIQRIYEVKKRPQNMPVSILVRDIKMMQDFAHISERTAKIIRRFLPGALTLVLPAKDMSLPKRLYSDNRYLGFRIPDHPFCRAILEHFQYPIISTSVNISHTPALTSIQDIEGQFGNEVQLFISDSRLNNAQHSLGSTVIKMTDDSELQLLREGSILFTEINRLFL